jgi:hypothetical protein
MEMWDFKGWLEGLSLLDSKDALRQISDWINDDPSRLDFIRGSLIPAGKKNRPARNLKETATIHLNEFTEMACITWKQAKPLWGLHSKEAITFQRIMGYMGAVKCNRQHLDGSRYFYHIEGEDPARWLAIIPDGPIHISELQAEAADMFLKIYDGEKSINWLKVVKSNRKAFNTKPPKGTSLNAFLSEWNKTYLQPRMENASYIRKGSRIYTKEE